MRFADRVVLVAGGTGALGRAVVLAFLAEGAEVVAAGRRPGELDAVAAAAGAARSRLGFAQADVSVQEGAARAVEEALRRRGRLDALVNAVGGWTGGAPVLDEAPDALERMLALNLRPGHALARAALAHMVPAGRGAIVEIASAAAVGPQPGQASYGASKAAALSLFQSIAEELRPRGVRVNVVLPGTMDTEANRRAMPGADRSTWVSTGDVARTVLFLCSDDARAVSGAAIPVRGGAARIG
jgi:NAD(P)-dependent dehydrogenase (short-subunit alcohol dehydrogenase family)